MYQRIKNKEKKTQIYELLQLSINKEKEKKKR